MSQSVVTIRLNGHPYQIGCGAGEENHVAKLGTEVEAVIKSLTASVGQIGEARLLAMVALILADRNVAPPTSTDNMAAVALEDAAERIAALASKLASGATSF
ncbi:cell division protein ZapA [Candidatus Puniceispirillum sp.]|nr:cell division protein ZapA [Candidatus Puniceispirillum sp.]